MEDMELLRRAYEREHDTRDRRPPHLRSWEYYTIGASRKDISRFLDEGLLIVAFKTSGLTKYKLSEKGTNLVWATTMEREFAKIPAASVLEAMDLVVGFDDIKDAIAQAVESRRRVNFLLEGPPASIRGDTGVWIDTGKGPQSVPIASLQGKTFKALGVHPMTLKAGWYPAELSSHEYEGEWIEIKACGVLPFTVTATHSLVSFSPYEGGLVPKCASKIKVGDIIPIISRWQIEPIKEIQFNGVSLPLDAELGFLIGFWLGDGGLSQGRTKMVTFSNYKAEPLKRVQRYLAKLKGYRNYNGGCLTKKCLNVQHQGLYQFLKEHFLAGDGPPGVKGRTARWKKLPGWVLAAPDDFIRELQNGYFFADGTVANGVISATSASSTLVRDMAMLLTRLGIVPGIQHRSHDARAIVLRQCDAALFLDKVGTFRENKTVSTSAVLHDESFKVPFPFDDVAAASLQAALRKGRYSQSFTLRAANNFILINLSETLLHLILSDIRWVRVDKVRRWQEPRQTVYDLSIPRAETFVLDNRVLVHNCAKSIMLEGVRSAVPNAYIAFGSRTSAPGLSEALFEHQPSVLLMDECDKVHMDCYSVLLGLMESGEILETKSRKTRGIKLETMVIAACNSTAKMPREFLSRFALHVLFPAYSREEFIDVCRGFLTRAENCPSDLAALIGQTVFDCGLGDVRKARGVWQLMVAPTEDEVHRVIRLMLKYSPDNRKRQRVQAYRLTGF